MDVMTRNYRKNDAVEWNWAGGTGRGKVEESFTEKVTRTIKGSEITRNATPDEPAYLIVQEDGDKVLKSHGELRKAG
jgi:N-methylhydantoinase B/oxoprolinase/acetone carboxylase alpha subunit